MEDEFFFLYLFPFIFNKIFLFRIILFFVSTVSTKQALISLASALFGIIFISLLLCLCCCLCQCCKIRNNDEERVALLGDSLATHHFRRASYYNYNRNRPFERRGRTISTGTANSLMQYGRNWRASDDYMYGYGGPTTQSMLWVNDNSGVPTDYSIGSNNGSGEWRRWEKKREELLAKYAKSSNEA
ncbi:hypothetical protein Glove_208g137 [Diversispora epigaea]|uniref:Uncharacterized protein n=1 Tax=Diversispora epigaea TaxID=1348612 RepID=A0A397IJF4_9GLOM|nr:hypothetical protein Glove_208g137 [Diversispora epigaea]